MDVAAERLAIEEEQKDLERQTRENDCKELSIRYTQPTRMGRWCEDAFLKDAKAQEYEEELRASQTYFNKQNFVFAHLYENVKLAKHEPTIMYDLPIQIRSNVHTVITEETKEPVLNISVMITELQFATLNMISLNEQSKVTVCPETKCVRRNVWRCVSIERTNPSTPILYGKDFYIRLFDSPNMDLYLTGAVPTVDNFGETAGRIPIQLTSTPDRFCKFRIVDPNPDRMISVMGTPVPTFARVAVAHTLTHQLLAIQLDDYISTSYSVDHPLVCYTHKDSQHRVTSENFWMFVTQSVEEGEKE